LIRQYNITKDELERVTELKREAENKLKMLLGENESGVIGDNYISWKSVAQERFDSKTFESEHPDLFRKYTRQSSYRRFTVKAAS
jgi:predicted phage-related endonuclease